LQSRDSAVDREQHQGWILSSVSFYRLAQRGVNEG
jgi:hypothetical protein